METLSSTVQTPEQEKESLELTLRQFLFRPFDCRDLLFFSCFGYIIELACRFCQVNDETSRHSFYEFAESTWALPIWALPVIFTKSSLPFAIILGENLGWFLSPSSRKWKYDGFWLPLGHASMLLAIIAYFGCEFYVDFVRRLGWLSPLLALLLFLLLRVRNGVRS
jgi:hypothetical protein